MILFVEKNDDEEEDEAEEAEGGIDDALLGELTEDDALDDGLLEELDPLLKATVLDPLAPTDEEEMRDEDGKPFDDEEEEVDDYDSFDDEDEM